MYVANQNCDLLMTITVMSKFTQLLRPATYIHVNLLATTYISYRQNYGNFQKPKIIATQKYLSSCIQ